VIRFGVPVDKDLRYFTQMAVALTAGLTVLTLLITGPQLAVGPVWVGAPLLIIPLLVALLWAIAPRAFSVDGEALHIERLLWTVTLPLRSIRNAAMLREGALQGAKREMSGVSLFAHQGRYSSPSLGCFRLYARRWGGPFVLLGTGQEQLVLAPSDAQGLMGALRARAPHVEVGQAEPKAEGRPTPTWLSFLKTVVVLGPPLVVPALFYPTWAHSPVSIGVKGESIHIALRHAPPIDLSLGRITGIEPLDVERLDGMRPENGRAYDDVAYGTYLSDDLGRFRLFAFRRSGYVLLEGADGRVVITPDDPDGFVKDARALMAKR
jgi:hypothetical protein